LPAPKPPIEDVITRLPRDSQRLFQRTPEDVEFIVINHTAAPPITPLQTIAAAFHRRLPGILYQFFIASNGSVYQTQPLMQVVDGKVPYIARAINIGFAGEFNDDIPTPAQIKSGRELISWLMEEFPQLTLASIRGVNEFINHTSPGEQWLQGRRWKDILINAVRTGADTSAMDEAISGDEEFLRSRGQQPPSSEQGANRETAAFGREGGRLQQGVVDARGQPNQRERVARPQIRDISHELPRHPTVQYRRRQLAAITHIAIHHTALPPSVGPERIAQAHVAEDLDRGKRAWSGIGYHYFIPADGEILQTQPVELRTFHVGRHNSYTIGVVFAGSFMNGSTPTARQIHSAARLIAWLLQEFQLQISNVLGHQEFSDNSTACPGSEWLEGKVWRDTLIAEIERVQSGVPPYHYVLFPTEETMTTTMAEASNYFDEFKPEAGTFLEDALQARYVTLVESGTGPSAEAERRLANAGVEIDRLDNSDAISATQRLLQLAHDGRRFRSLLES
jgi:N-acetylmuramoyl-L-alanine amidase